MSTVNAGLVAAYLLDGNGGGTSLDWDAVRRWEPADGVLWVHLDYLDANSREYMAKESGIEPIFVAAMLAEDIRPRALVSKGSLLSLLRGVNMNSGADPEDMVSLRVWIDATRIVSLRHRRVMAVTDLRDALESGDGPRNPADFLILLLDRLESRIGEVVGNLDDAIDGIEDEVLTAESYELRSRIGAFRRQAIALRRYLAPQREVVLRLPGETVGWLSELDRQRLREVADRVTRHLEDLDSARDRAAVCQDELNSRLSEQMNRTMYVLSIVAAIFLPLGLITGLLGINVGGVPGTENPWAFTIVCVLLVGFALLQSWFFRRRKWL